VNVCVTLKAISKIFVVTVHLLIRVGIQKESSIIEQKYSLLTKLTISPALIQAHC
jgi:hypothetical protein